MYAPQFSQAFFEASDSLGLPVLWIPYPLPFVAVARAVAEATLTEQSQRLVRTARIYDAMRRTTAARRSTPELINALARELHAELYVCETDNAQTWHPDLPAPDDGVAAGLARYLISRRHSKARTFIEVLDDGREYVLSDVPTHPDAILVAVAAGAGQLDRVLLQHAVTVIALELSHVRLALEFDRRAGAELLAQLIDGRMDRRSADRQLTNFGLRTDTMVLIAIRNSDPGRLRDMHLPLWRSRTPHVAMHRSGVVHALIPGDNLGPDLLTPAVGKNAYIGISRPVKSIARIADSLREANWAAGLAQRSGDSPARYGEAIGGLDIGDMNDAQALVDRVLHTVLDYDAEHRTELVETLETFLAQRRSWQRTATTMQLHRQTVIYRIRKVEELSGRQLAETSDLLELWMAVRAWRLLGG
jgi:purine catabolism regulator